MNPISLYTRLWNVWRSRQSVMIVLVSIFSLGIHSFPQIPEHRKSYPQILHDRDCFCVALFYLEEVTEIALRVCLAQNTWRIDVYRRIILLVFRSCDVDR